jgi:hypothetical protein
MATGGLRSLPIPDSHPSLDGKSERTGARRSWTHAGPSDGAEEGMKNPSHALQLAARHRIKLYLCIIKSIAAKGRTTPPP